MSIETERLSRRVLESDKPKESTYDRRGHYGRNHPSQTYDHKKVAEQTEKILKGLEIVQRELEEARKL